MGREQEREEERAAIDALRKKVAEGPSVKLQPWWASWGVSIGIVMLGIAAVMLVTWIADYQITLTTQSGAEYRFP
jgi:hypothetical protein